MATTAVEMAVAAGMATTAGLATATVWRQRGGSGRIGGGSGSQIERPSRRQYGARGTAAWSSLPSGGRWLQVGRWLVESAGGR
uniref:Uncharacterized protein n=1 Tax=Oryza nivara TaxID=4536 RepID=A0A0E0HED4_ORYNI